MILINQSDIDGDGIGDVCDICPQDPDDDIDNDGVCGDIDNCIDDSNTNQSDMMVMELVTYVIFVLKILTMILIMMVFVEI